jgi:hypothetical protein
MSARLALWILWTALSLCLPGMVRLELCLCDGPRGLFDGVPCGAAQAETQACCCAPERGDAPRLGRGDAEGCGCVRLEAQRGEPIAHATVTPAGVLRAPSRPLALSVLPPACAPRPARAARARVRPRALDGVPLRI